MISLKDFENYNLSVNWKVVYIGWNSNFIFKRQLRAKEIINFAISKLDEENENILKLAACFENEEDTISNYLSLLAEEEISSYSISLKKWEVIFVIKELPPKNIDFIQGLLALGEIWIELNFPNDCPHIFQGQENSISPNDYYTYKNFIFLYNKHLEWIKENLDYLSKQR